MKYLQDYIAEKQTIAFEKAGAFFAFSEKQFLEQKLDGVVYSRTSVGMFCPEKNIDTLESELKEILLQGLKDDIAENGFFNIIKRELANHESYHTGDIDDAYYSLKKYNVTFSDVKQVFDFQMKQPEILESLS